MCLWSQRERTASVRPPTVVAAFSRRARSLYGGATLTPFTLFVDTGFPNGESRRAVSDASGRFVVFQTTATNLIFDDTNDFEDIFLWDTAANPNSSAAVQLLSRGRLGSAARGPAEYAMLADDASRAYFVGMATNYVSDPPITCSLSLIYQVDLLASNATNALVTRLISVSPNGTLPTRPTCVTSDVTFLSGSTKHSCAFTVSDICVEHPGMVVSSSFTRRIVFFSRTPTCRWHLVYYRVNSFTGWIHGRAKLVSSVVIFQTTKQQTAFLCATSVALSASPTVRKATHMRSLSSRS